MFIVYGTWLLLTDDMARAIICLGIATFMIPMMYLIEGKKPKGDSNVSKRNDRT